MENFIVYGLAAGLFFTVFPVYFSVYAYLNTETRYASANFCVFRFIRFLNINTADGGGKMQVNGKDMQLDLPQLLKNSKILLDNVCVFKIVQLGDYGVREENNAYLALLQNAATLPLYKYLEGTGSRCKLRNYSIINAEHSELHYCGKAVCVINMLAAIKILFIIFSERFR
ncbi:MAG: hypothetical protein LUD27_03585 [Clostridia bacterium]|nr:hypothetical protein [Clostridia bacterium]